jgi:protein regulator of cytokinesis 1
VVEECHQLISQIKEMERSMADGDAEFDDDDDDFKVTMPLMKCLNGLKERHKLIKRHHAERYDAIKSMYLQ